MNDTTTGDLTTAGDVTAVPTVDPADTVDRYQAPDQSAVTAGASPSDPGSRGRTTIGDQVAARIATIAAGEVPGVVPAGSGMAAAFGRQYPNVSADVAGDRTLVTADIAVNWGTDVAATAAAVRDHVRSQLKEYAGLTADRVDVTVAAVNGLGEASTSPPRRVT